MRNVPSSTTTTGARGVKYSSEEGVCLARAFNWASTDPAVVSDQKTKKYYFKILECYRTMKPGHMSLRLGQSVDTRVKLMVKECMRLAACFRMVAGSKKSWTKAEDIIWLAMELVNKVKMKWPSDHVRRPFYFLEPWNILCVPPKFSTVESANAKGGSIDLPSSHDGSAKEQSAAKGDDCTVVDVDGSRDSNFRSKRSSAGREGTGAIPVR